MRSPAIVTTVEGSLLEGITAKDYQICKLLWFDRIPPLIVPNRIAITCVASLCVVTDIMFDIAFS